MTDRELNIALREMARSNGLCDKWFESWKDDDTIDECLDRYVRGFDFAVKNDYPPIDFIRRNFRKDDLHRHNIYVDEKVDMTIGNGIYIFLGHCTGNVKVEDLVAATLYLRHECDLSVSSVDGAITYVSCYDDSHAMTECDKYSTIKVYNHITKHE